MESNDDYETKIEDSPQKKFISTLLKINNSILIINIFGAQLYGINSKMILSIYFQMFLSQTYLIFIWSQARVDKQKKYYYLIYILSVCLLFFIFIFIADTFRFIGFRHFIIINWIYIFEGNSIITPILVIIFFFFNKNFYENDINNNDIEKRLIDNKLDS